MIIDDIELIARNNARLFGSSDEDEAAIDPIFDMSEEEVLEMLELFHCEQLS